MIDRDTIIDFVAAVDTEFMKREVGTYNGFDMYEMFAMYVEAKVRKEEREACAKVCEAIAQEMYDQGEGPTGYISWVADCHLRIRARGQE